MVKKIQNEKILSPSKNKEISYFVEGMPALNVSGKQVSFYEFWPTWLMYLPVLIQSIFLGLWHRSITLPLIANPHLALSGMVGVEKSILMNQSQGLCKKLILPWFLFVRSKVDIATQIKEIENKIEENCFNFPLVCKPDIGCRGSGVKLVHDIKQLEVVLRTYSVGVGILVQTLSTWEPEAGVFYVRHPDEETGSIISMALKYSPYVVGDGVRTLRQLIISDPRAEKLQAIYFERHKPLLKSIIDKGVPFKLVFSASHCRGAIFRDARQYVTTELSQRIDQVMKDIPEFYYGRLDIKFRDIDSLMRGENIEIVEINSASSESLHIWDRKTTLANAMYSLLFQYRILFTLGAKNRKRGYRTPSIFTLLKAWKKERKLTRSYPITD